MPAIDTSMLKFGVKTVGVVRRKSKQRRDKAAWRKASKVVDTRDAVDGDPVCFITGKRLQVQNRLDEWTFRDRAHLEGRAQSKARRFDPTNVISVCVAIHTLVDRCALLLLNKRGLEAKTVRTIDHVAWNRRMIARGEEPCRIRKGLAVRELPA